MECNFKSKHAGYCMLKNKIALNSCKCDGIENCILFKLKQEG